MNRKFLYLILIGSLLACKKEKTVSPGAAAPVRIATRVEDTVPDHASFKLRLAKDAAAIDETMFIFNHNATGHYTNSRDAVYFQGFGTGSLASLSSDSIACAIHVIPYRAWAATRLKVEVKTTGVYNLGISDISHFPAGVHIWLQDVCRKDSMDLRVGNYAFYVDKSDTATFGSRRFKVVLN